MKNFIALICGSALLGFGLSLPAQAQVDLVDHGDGSMTAVDSETGVAVHEDADGSVTAIDEDGNAVYVDADGTVAAEDAEGNLSVIDAEGNEYYENADGDSLTIVNE